MFRGLLVIFLSSITLFVPAQDFSKKQYKIEDGLPTEMIKAITQDSLGNFWIATDEGFVRYNAARFDGFQNITQSNYTKGFYRTKRGRLIAFGDLDMFEMKPRGDSMVFDPLVPVSTAVNDSSLTYPKLLYEDSHGSLWVSESQSVVRLDHNSLKRYPFGLADRTPQFLRSFAFFEDGNQDLFTVSVAGNVFRYNKEVDQFEKSYLTFPSQIEFASVINNRLVIGALHGLYTADLAVNGEFNQPRLMLPIRSVSYVEALPNGSYFVGTRGADHFIVDSAFTRSTLAVTGVNDVNHVYVSTEKDIWLSTSEGILFMQESAFQGPAGASNTFVETVVEDIKMPIIYYATRNELHSLDPKTQEDKLLVNDIKNSYFQSLVSTRKGVWAANAFQVLLIDGNKIVKSYDFSDQRMFVTSLDKDSEENVWLTIPGRRTVLMIDKDLELHEYRIPLAGDGFINIVKDGGDGIYVASKGSDYLYYKGYSDTVFRSISVPLSQPAHHEFNTFSLVVNGSFVWLATSAGLMRYDHETIERVDLGEGFTGVPVRSIVGNEQDGFILATPKELLYYHTASGDGRLFASAMNLTGLTVNARSLLISSDKKVWIGTSRGVFSSNRRLTDKMKTIRPQFAYADVDGKRISTLARDVIPYNILLSMAVTSVTFPEEERIFEFRYADDQPWRRLKGTSIDIITSNPGSQYIQVRARKTGTFEWSDVTSMYFHVSRPFWMTIWFYALIVVILALIVTFTGVIVRARGARQKRILEGLVADRTAQLAEANRELEGFSYSVSHDLRAPLRSVLAFSQMLDEDYGAKLDEDGKKGVASIVRNANRMNQLIDDLLKFSKALHQGISKAPVNLNHMVTETIELIRDSGGYKDTIVNVEPLPTVMADRGLLSQVWQNLVSNAMKYSSKATKPQVDITCVEKGDEYEFCVKDNGAGFDMQYAEKLFGVFQRLHSEKEFAGTGIGLALVKRILMRHGGRIWAEGVVGEGARFYFTLPK